MAELIDRLPGGIKGLLRTGSPVHDGDRRGVVLITGAPNVWVICANGRTSATAPLPSRPSDLAIDLTDPTGRVHAAWYAAARQPRDGSWSEREVRAVRFACDGLPMTPEQIDTLARLVLRLAADDLYDMMAAMRST